MERFKKTTAPVIPMNNPQRTNELLDKYMSGDIELDEAKELSNLLNQEIEVLKQTHPQLVRVSTLILMAYQLHFFIQITEAQKNEEENEEDDETKDKEE